MVSNKQLPLTLLDSEIMDYNILLGLDTTVTYTRADKKIRIKGCIWRSPEPSRICNTVQLYITRKINRYRTIVDEYEYDVVDSERLW